MFTVLSPWVYQGRPLITVFRYRYERRWKRRQRKFILEPGPVGPHLEDLTTEEVGQLLGGN